MADRQAGHAVNGDPEVRPPAPRRVRMGPTAWDLVREAAAEAGLGVSRLPATGAPTDDRAAARAELHHAGVLSDTGLLSRGVHAGVAVLATAPIALTTDRLTGDRRVQSTWATLGVPTAGVVVTDEAAGDGTVDRTVELQVLAVDDLFDTVIGTLGLSPDPAPDHVAGDPVDVPVASTSPEPLPPQLGTVVDDGQVAARAVLHVVGPTGRTGSQLVGDGLRWWQVGATSPEQVRWVPVDGPSVRASLVSTLAGHLSGGGSGEGADGG